MTETENTSPENAEDKQLQIRGIGSSTLTVGAEIVTKYTASLDNEEHKEAIRWLYGWAREKRYGWKELEAETKISTTSLYRLFSGTYQAKLDGIVERIHSYRKVAEERASIRKIGFVETSIARKMFKAFEYAMLSQSMVFVYGISQIGKTFTALHFKDENNHGRTKYVRLPASAGVQLCMKEIAKACFVSPKSSFENLRERVLNSLDGDNLLIIDELHQVFLSYQKGSAVKVLEVLREIHDRTHCGMVLIGTRQLKKELMLGSHVELLEQFKRRGVLEIMLPNTPPAKDLTKISSAYGLTEEPTGEAEELRKDILTTHGLGKYCKFLQAAGRIASKSDEPLTWVHFVKAHDILAKLGGAE